MIKPLFLLLEYIEACSCGWREETVKIVEFDCPLVAKRKSYNRKLGTLTVLLPVTVGILMAFRQLPRFFFKSGSDLTLKSESKEKGQNSNIFLTKGPKFRISVWIITENKLNRWFSIKRTGWFPFFCYWWNRKLLNCTTRPLH